VSARTTFDSHADDYEAALGQGLAVSGESAEFFARARVEWLAGRLRQQGVVAPAVLDFGCGTGIATPFFFELLGARSVVGVDESAKSLEVARRNHGRTGARFVLTAEHVPDASVDLVHCNGVFHHVPPRSRTEAARYVAACLAPRGRFALWENNPWSPAARYVMSRIPFDRGTVMVWPREARRLARAVGLVPRLVDYCFIFPRALKALRGSERYVSALPLGAQYLLLAEKA
jgi:SAM-dependent methyltransferase